MKYEIGHTLEEYMKLWGNLYKEGTLWDFSEEELEDGSIEPNNDFLYWKIDGRYYETGIELEVK